MIFEKEMVGIIWQTFIIGGSWLLVGIAYLAIRTRGFRKKLEVQDVF